jgi:hypothetical protein
MPPCIPELARALRGRQSVCIAVRSEVPPRRGVRPLTPSARRGGQFSRPQGSQLPRARGLCTLPWSRLSSGFAVLMQRRSIRSHDAHEAIATP